MPGSAGALNLTYYWFPVVVAVTVGFGLLTKSAWPGGVLFLSLMAYFAQGADCTDGYLAEPRLAGAMSVGIPVLMLAGMILTRVFGSPIVPAPQWLWTAVD